MKTALFSERPRTEQASKNSPCWSKDAQAQLLRVELAGEQIFLFPYAHLHVVEFARRGDSDLLKLCFARHEVRITGRQLRELGLAFQALAVDWVRELPARYAAVAPRDTVCIAGIKVTELQVSQPEGGQSG